MLVIGRELHNFMCWTQREPKEAEGRSASEFDLVLMKLHWPWRADLLVQLQCDRGNLDREALHV